MTERQLPANLALLYDAFSKEAIDNLLSGETFRIGDVEFVCGYSPESTSRRFFIVKPHELVERYRQLCAGTWKHAVIVELGIAEGGSTALLALLAEPAKLIAVDIEPQLLGALAQFIDECQLSGVVRPYYGVDQADRARLAQVVDRERGGELLDLVIDDASHEFSLTRASFEVLFPRLRPGGMYVIEDWNAAHTMRDAVRRFLADTSNPDYEEHRRAFQEARVVAEAQPDKEVPLSRLAVELLLTAASLGDAVASVSVDRYWLTVQRGPAPLDPDSFRLSDLYADYFGFLPTLP